MQVPTVRTNSRQVQVACPGCSRTIVVPAQPTADNWTDKPYWCVACGGSAKQVVKLGQRQWGDPR